eukprot:SAG11_NODE_9772_length_881_cov_2.739130_2_plen_123_part_00
MWLVQVHRYRYVQIDMYSYELHMYRYVPIERYSCSYVQVVPVPGGVPSTATTTKSRILSLTSSKKWRAARRQFWQNCDKDKKQGLSTVLQKLSIPIMLLEFIRFSTLFGSTKVLVIPVPIRY